jgi:hypothetical protein
MLLLLRTVGIRCRCCYLMERVETMRPQIDSNRLTLLWIQDTHRLWYHLARQQGHFRLQAPH